MMKLRKKFTLIFILYLMAFGLINGYFLYTQIVDFLTEELIANTTLYLEKFSEEILSYLVKGNIITLNEIVYDFKNKTPSVVYVYVIDFDGKVVASTFTDGFPKALIGFNRPVNDEISIRRFQAYGSTIYDVSAPVYRGIGGEVHIGITNREIEEKTLYIIGKIFMLGSIVVIIGAVSFFTSLTSLTSSIKNLENAVKKILDGDYKSRIKTITQDEIGVLSEAINQMLDKLEEEREKTRRYIDKLKRLKSRYKILVDSIQDAVMLISSDGMILSWNKACERIFNISRSEAINKNFTEVVKLKEAPQSGEIELSLKPYGRNVYLKLSVLNLDKESKEKIIIARDITSEKAKEEFYKRVRQYEKIAIIHYLAAGVIHKINTILTRITLNCELILTEFKEELNKQRMEEVISQVMEIKHIIDDLLKYGKRGIKINRKIVDLVELVESSLKTCLSGVDGIKVVKKYGRTCKAYVDPLGIRLVIDNLVMNAIQAMPEGGELTIEINQNDSHVFISVKDNGRGMSREEIHKIFEPFYTRYKDKGGIGLGLTISQEIVKMHGGEITVESEPRRGSVFIIKLPRGGSFD